jgi:hypothetical protein
MLKVEAVMAPCRTVMAQAETRMAIRKSVTFIPTKKAAPEIGSTRFRQAAFKLLLH